MAQEDDNVQEENRVPTKSRMDNKKVLSTIGIIILILIPVILSLHVRVQPLSLDGLEDRIEASVINNIYNQIAAQVRAQNPGVPDSFLRESIDELFLAEVTRPGFREELERFVKENAEAQKDYYRHDGTDWNYMQDIDTYHWLRLVENIVETGKVREDTVDGEAWDTYVWAPVGRSIEGHTMLHPYIVANFHNVVSRFNDFTVERSYIYHSVFYALVVLLVFLVTWRISNIWGGFFAAMTIALVPGSLGRTLFGRASTDIWNVFFPLLILFLFLEAMVQTKRRNKLLLAGGAGLASVIFAAIWDAWWHAGAFVFAIAGIYFAYLVIYTVIKKGSFTLKSLWNTPSIKNIILITLIYIATVSLFGIILLGNIGLAFEPFQGPFGALQLKEVTRGSFFPNVHTTVAELRPVDNINNVVSALLGNVNVLGINMNMDLFIVSIVGILLLAFYRKHDDGTMDLRYSIGLLIWFAVTIFITFRGIRFVLLLAPAFSVAFGVALGLFVAYMSRILGNLAKDRKYEVVGLLVVLLLVLFFFTPQPVTDFDGTRSIRFYGMYGQAFDIARNDIPMVDDDFHGHLTYIKENSNEDAIMTSWWDFGHYFKYIADRRVTFDGGTQSSHAAHWAGRLFITGDERESVGIKRMLDCSAAFTFININENVEPDEFRALRLIEELITLDDNKARTMLLERGYSEEDADYILAQTHCTPPRGLVVASGDMQGKAGVWGHFGSWNFERADVYNVLRSQRLSRDNMITYIEDRLGLERPQAAALYHQLRAYNVQQAQQWIAPFPSIFGSAGCTDSENAIICNANLGAPVTINISREYLNATATIRDQNNAVQTVPIRFGYLNSTGDYIVTGPEDNLIGLGASLIRRNNGYEVMLSDPAYVGSVFSLMYYYDGEGLSCYEPFRLDIWRTAGKLNTFMPSYDCDYVRDSYRHDLQDYAGAIAITDDMFVIDEMDVDETVTIPPVEEDVISIEDLVSIDEPLVDDDDVVEAANES
ncbi:MAG: STT3 domain-containing protein [Candidatus Woesearchaeota archaeon]